MTTSGIRHPNSQPFLRIPLQKDDLEIFWHRPSDLTNLQKNPPKFPDLARKYLCSASKHLFFSTRQTMFATMTPIAAQAHKQFQQFQRLRTHHVQSAEDYARAKKEFQIKLNERITPLAQTVEGHLTTAKMKALEGYEATSSKATSSAAKALETADLIAAQARKKFQTVESHIAQARTRVKDDLATAKTMASKGYEATVSAAKVIGTEALKKYKQACEEFKNQPRPKAPRIRKLRSLAPTAQRHRMTKAELPIQSSLDAISVAKKIYAPHESNPDLKILLTNSGRSLLGIVEQTPPNLPLRIEQPQNNHQPLAATQTIQNSRQLVSTIQRSAGKREPNQTLIFSSALLSFLRAGLINNVRFLLGIVEQSPSNLPLRSEQPPENPVSTVGPPTTNTQLLKKKQELLKKKQELEADLAIAKQKRAEAFLKIEKLMNEITENIRKQ